MGGFFVLNMRKNISSRHRMCNYKKSLLYPLIKTAHIMVSELNRKTSINSQLSKGNNEINQFQKKFNNYLDAILEVFQSVNTEMDNLTIYNVLLDRLATQLEIDCAALLLMTPANVLVYTAGRGFRTKTIRNSRVGIGESLAGRAAEERQIIYFSDLSSNNIRPAFRKLMNAEGFIAYLAIPLVAENMVKGVMELFHRAPLKLDTEWMQFLTIMAEQTAAAIHKAEMTHNQKRANQELEVAYGATLEAWAQALELRDRETAGHTQRVMELSLRLSTKLGIPEETLVHITRGALLHDIGKLVIPDKILQKTGPLEESEWVVMREHPNFAYELLKPIDYLEPAIDIPYCHHEKWNGSGYPRGLKKDEIPFPARIFTVVDVFDALVTKRPYRPAWSRDKALEYIDIKSGEEFDPLVVGAFFEILEEDKSSTEPVKVNDR